LTTAISDAPPEAAPGNPPAKPGANALRRPLWKGIAFRLAAVAIGLSPLVAIELTLRGLDLGQPTQTNDPFVGFSDIHPLFVLNDPADQYIIPRSRQTHFEPESFAAAKPPGEYRIFVLGGSTVQGRPWSIATSLTTWLELHLNAADPSRTYDVVNCGGVSYASYRLVPILEEVLHYQPDLVIFCEGHNEFLEDRDLSALRSRPAALAWIQRQVMQLRTYNVLRDAWLRLSGGDATGDDTAGGDATGPSAQPQLGPEVDARLDWKDGLAEYHRDPAWRTGVVAHFDDSLRRIVRTARDAGVPLVLVSPVSNLEYPPFKSEHRADISASELAWFDALMAQARQSGGADLTQTLALIQQAAAIDGAFARVHYDIGVCRLELGEVAQARQSLERAKELDVCPLRMIEPIEQSIHSVAEETDTPLVDAHALIAAASRSGFPDRQWLVDHVHPSISGHQLIADALADELAGLRIVSRRDGWAAARDEAYRNHLASLDHVYFERGKSRLRSEQGWARGWVKRARDP
jgi:lysophospholipase L1-like esterase